MSTTTLRTPGRQSKLPVKKFITPRQRVFGRLALHRNRLLVTLDKSDDLRLASLTLGLGSVGGSIKGNPLAPDLAPTLDRIAAYCLGWAEKLYGKDVFPLVHNERERQEQLLKAGKFLFNCASPVADPQRKLRVLVEEVGEVAEAIDKIELAEARGGGASLSIQREHLQTELVQVAAVCVAWLESMEGK